MSETEAKMIKLVLSRGETGWAEDLGDGLARIANISIDKAGPRVDDIVRLKPSSRDRIPEIDSVISRRYKSVVTIWYDEMWQYHKLVDVLILLGAQPEGGVSATEHPEARKRGFFSVAYNPPIDPLKIADGIGIEDPNESKRTKEGK